MQKSRKKEERKKKKKRNCYQSHIGASSSTYATVIWRRHQEESKDAPK
jgi:hypothetical protein